MSRFHFANFSHKMKAGVEKWGLFFTYLWERTVVNLPRIRRYIQNLIRGGKKADILPTPRLSIT